MSRRWMRLCLQRNKWLCGRYQLFAKSIRHAQTYNQCSAVNDMVKLAFGYTPRNGDSHLLWRKAQTWYASTGDGWIRYSLCVVASRHKWMHRRWGALGTVFVVDCILGGAHLVQCLWFSANLTQHYAQGDYSTQEMLLVVDKLRDQDEALLQKVSLVTDLVGNCICMKRQVKDKKKGFNMEWATSEW
ncbi:hypothetical protein FB192DRAFT_1434364 [Mucor lusitanicus]|uniref:Uncharacterized protein n=2 Tax=Mucor circinelloides f. lusitanicus TaxID=29924 RepID=A0A168GIA7_MUCCL|nr:hypothetical protein FB192DRAFT_1434364 [Mucor lusitanicus]OAC97712.1 hypothetical protein MUCCIDRAFT_168241 [Mucor lusitanicus CBS 277.49]